MKIDTSEMKESRQNAMINTKTSGWMNTNSLLLTRKAMSRLKQMEIIDTKIKDLSNVFHFLH